MDNNINLSDLLGNRSQISVSDQLFQQISSLILSGKIEEGYVFPNETILCEQLNVGRTSLREAYKALELTGYITRTKKGTFVNSKNKILGATPIKSVFSSAKNSDFTEFRSMLEAESAYIAATKAGLDDIAALNALIEESKSAQEKHDYHVLIETDLKFHMEIARIADNELILSLINIMYASIRKNIENNFANIDQTNSPVYENMLPQHEKVVEAINKRDAKNARNAMREHIVFVSSNISMD